MNQQFLESLRRLAAPADEQCAYLRELGTAPSAEELALEFDDSFHAVKARLAADAREAASELNEQLDQISGSQRADLWTLDALYSSQWGKVRGLARRVIDLLRSES